MALKQMILNSALRLSALMSQPQLHLAEVLICPS